MSKPERAQEISAAAQELYERFLQRVEDGEAPAFESFLDEHLEHAAELQRLHARWERLAGVVDALGEDPADEPGATLRLVGEDDRASHPSQEAVDRLLQRLAARPGNAERYGTRGELGRGGMGVVLRAWDGDLRRQLAMKVMLPQDASKAADPASTARQLGRFLEEAQITGQLDHPGIVPVHELGVDAAGRLFFTMRLVRGRSLRTIFDLVRDGREGWTVPRTLGVLQKVCEALAYAHSKGVLHRDIKPANIMVGRFGEVYVMDWGLAKVLDREGAAAAPSSEEADDATLSEVRTERHDGSARGLESPLRTLDGAVVGTPAYMSPEQARGRLESLGPPSDVYAVGALLYHLLAGSMPYVPDGEKRSPREVLAALREGPPQPLHQLVRRADPELVAICEKAMAREPSERYANMQEMAEEFRAFLEGRVVRAHRTGALVELRKWIVRNKLSAAVLLVFLLSLAALGLRERQRNANLLDATLAARREQAEAEAARADAEQARARAEGEAARADAALASAESAADRARRQGYVASLAAAQAALADGNREDLLRHLADTPAALRGWEWAHLQARTDASLGAFGRHDAGVAALALTPDGARLASTSWVGELDLWHVASGERLARLPPGEAATNDLLFSADGRTLAVAGGDGRLRLLDAESGLLRAELPPPEGLSRRAPELTRLARAPGGELVVAGREDGRLLAWNLASGRPVALPRPHAEEITDLAFAPDGALLLTASRDRTAALVDVLAGELLTTLYDHAAPVSAVAHSPSAARFATADESGAVRVYEIDALTPRLEFDTAPEVPRRLVFSADGTRLVAAMESGNLHVWDAWTGRALDVLMGHAAAVQALVATPDGLRLLSGAADGELRAWDTSWGAARTRLQGHTDNVRSLAAAGDGERLLSAGWDGRARLWECASLLSLGVGDLPGGGAAAVAFAPDGTRAAAGLTDGGSREAYPLVLWRTDRAGALAETLQLQGHAAPVHAVAFDPTGQRLASASDDRSVRVWSTDRGALLQTLEGHAGWVRDVAFHPARPWLASAAFDESVRLWSLDDGRELAVLHDHARGVSAVAFGPDGRWLASAGEDRAVLLYDTRDGPHLVARAQGHRAPVNDLAFHPDGRRLASASDDGSVRLWSVPEGQALLRLDAGGPVAALAFSADGARLYAAVGTEILCWETTGAADDFARRHARDAALEPARRLFTDLLEALADPRRVTVALEADSDLEPAVRAEALRLVRNFGSDPELLTEAARALLVEREADPEVYREARRLARAANALAPGRAEALHMLGVAQFRCGDPRAALTSLTEARRINASVRAYPAEWDLLVLAMANAELGATALAEAYLEDALLSLEARGGPPGAVTGNLVREARARLDGAR